MTTDLDPDTRNQLIEKGAEALVAVGAAEASAGAAAVIDALQIETHGTTVGYRLSDAGLKETTPCRPTFTFGALSAPTTTGD